MSLSNEEKKRYSRQILLSEIGESGQEKLKAAKVLVIGAGGLGSPILLYLAATGVGTLGIMDGDVVDASNLQRQILYTSAEVGKPKAQVAALKVAAQNPFVTVKVHDFFLDNKNALELFRDYDLIVDGSDNFATRYLVNDACVLSGKPFVSGSIFRFEGQVSVFNFQNGPTYRCLFPEPPDPKDSPSCAEIGVSPILPGLIGSYQVNEVLKIFTGHGEVLSGKLLVLDATTNAVRLLKFKKNPAIQITKLLESYENFCASKITGAGVEEWSYDDLVHRVSSGEPIFLADVRTALEREMSGPIPLDELMGRSGKEKRFEEKWLDPETLPSEIKKIPIGKTVVLYCQKGVRSLQMAESLLAGKRTEHPLVSLKHGVEGVFRQKKPV